MDKQGKVTDANRGTRIGVLGEDQALDCLYVGTDDSMGAGVSGMRTSKKLRGLTLAGMHHAGYSSAPRRTVPKWPKSALRHLVRCCGQGTPEWEHLGR